MKHLLPFTLFCCFSISSMYAVQDQKTDVATNDQTIQKVVIKEHKIAKSRSTKKIVINTKKAQSKISRQRAAIGHTIKKVSHRQMIDSRKRLAGNY